MVATSETTTMGVPSADRGSSAGPVELERVLHEVYEEHHRRLMGYFLRRTHDRSLSEDLTHDTILRFAGAVDRFDWDRPVWPYLTATANNLLIDHRRRDHREVSVDVEGDPDTFEQQAASYDLDESVVLGSVLEEALSRLSDRQRVAVELRCRRGWNVQDAAEFLGVPPGTFNQLLYRARENLRARLDQVGARVSGLVLPWLTALRLRQRAATDRARDVVSTPGSPLGAEGLASVVMATTMAVVVAVGALPSVAVEGPLAASVAGIVSPVQDLAPTTARTSDGGPGSDRRPARGVTAGSVDVPEPVVAPPPGGGGRTTVIEAPQVVPDSDGHVAVSDDEERFVVTHEVETRSGVAGDTLVEGETVAIHCGTTPGAVVCTHGDERN